ncbi:hypothetical protein BG005_001824, partial [Podila minutissima]
MASEFPALLTRQEIGEIGQHGLIGSRDDIRHKRLGNILGSHTTKRLIAKLFFKMNSEEGLQECIAASNLLVGILHGRSNAHYLQRIGAQLESIRELYDFLADVPGAEIDVKLNAKRTGMVYGALIAFAMDVKDVQDEKARMLIAGIEASSAILSAVADGAMTALSPKGNSIIPKSITEVRDLLKEAVKNRNSKVRHATAKLGDAVTTNLLVVLEQNQKEKRIPGLYKEPAEDELKMYEVEALRVFSAVSQKLIRDS